MNTRLYNQEMQVKREHNDAMQALKGEIVKASQATLEELALAKESLI